MNDHGIPDYATQNEHNNLRTDVKELDGKVDQLAQNTYLGIESVHKRLDALIRPPAIVRALDTPLGRAATVAMIGAFGVIGAAVINH